MIFERTASKLLLGCLVCILAITATSSGRSAVGYSISSFMGALPLGITFENFEVMALNSELQDQVSDNSAVAGSKGGLTVPTVPDPRDPKSDVVVFVGTIATDHMATRSTGSVTVMSQTDVGLDTDEDLAMTFVGYPPRLAAIQLWLDPKHGYTFEDAHQWILNHCNLTGCEMVESRSPTTHQIVWNRPVEPGIQLRLSDTTRIPEAEYRRYAIQWVDVQALGYSTD